MKVCKRTKERVKVDEYYEVCTEYCCRKMKKYLKLNRYPTDGICFNTSNGKFMIPAEEVRGQYEDYYRSKEIKYCPFCGERLQ